jgi:uncharacterized protein YndB with AHSA1/START domain
MPRELTITRIFNAPRALVFKAWIQPQHLAQWWGPKGYTNPVVNLDVRPGGSLHIEMTGDDGIAIPITGTFIEVVEPEHLVFTTTNFPDENGVPQFEVHNSVTFESIGDKTKLTLHAVIVKSLPEFEASIAGMEQGWNESLDRLTDELTHVL